MCWIKKAVYLVIGWTIGLVIVLGAFELGLRSPFFKDPWGSTVQLNLVRNRTISYKVDELFQSKKSIVEYIRNEYGLRDSCSDSSKIDILTIGGSTTDQRYVPLKSTWQHILQNKLSTQLTKSICVSNAGVDGHSTFGHLASFEHWFPLIPDLQPKITLLYIGLNDANFHRTGANIGADVSNGTGYKGLLKTFQIVQALLPIWRMVVDLQTKLPYSGHFPRSFKQAEYVVKEANSTTQIKSFEHSIRFRDRLTKLLSYVEETGAKPVCVTQPHRFVKVIDGTPYGVADILGEGISGLDFDISMRDLNKNILQVCGKANTIQLHDVLFKSDHFYDGVHNSSAGSEYIGVLLADEFIKRGFML